KPPRPEEEQPPTPSAPQWSLTPRPLYGKGPSKSPLMNVRNSADLRLQMPAAIELNVISQPPGSVRAENLPGFAYAAKAGKGATIYVIDTGANIENPEWKNMKGSKSFINTPGVEKSEADPEVHGSCMASKVTGRLFGTAKDANIVMVKIHHNGKGSASTLSALVETSNDVYKKLIQGKAEDGFNKLSDYPAPFGRITDITVVGAVEEDGSRSPYSLGTAKELT
ncbi:Subtilisin-like protease 7, partial [Colletotrichum shisoi]